MGVEGARPTGEEGVAAEEENDMPVTGTIQPPREKEIRVYLMCVRAHRKRSREKKERRERHFVQYNLPGKKEISRQSMCVRVRKGSKEGREKRGDSVFA